MIPGTGVGANIVSAAAESFDLVADVGGTNLRMCLLDASGRLHAPRVLACGDYPGIEEAIEDYLGAVDGIRPRRACLAVATAVDEDPVRLTNSPWVIARASVRSRCNLDDVRMINDFEGQALAIPHLDELDLRSLGGGPRRMDRPMAVIGPGTGLGVAGLVPDGDHWRAVGGEGGHVPFAPASEEEVEIWRLLRRQRRHISAEDLLSGPGIERLYRLLCEIGGEVAEPLVAAEITARGMAGTCLVCVRVIEHFSAMLGTAACTVALTFGARGGIYIGGGIVPRLGDHFDVARFRSRIEIDGPRAGYMAEMATSLITADHPALLGAASVLRPGKPIVAARATGQDAAPRMRT